MMKTVHLPPPPPRVRQYHPLLATSDTRGFTLVELLVALALFALALTALAALQAVTLKMADQSQAQHQALLLANSVLQQLQMRRGDVAAQTQFIHEWQQQVQQQLPRGEGQVQVGGRTVITITWQEKPRADATGSTNTRPLVTRQVVLTGEP